MSYIKTWVERCDEHPNHQSGMVSNGMIQARMQEEIDDLRAEIERLRKALQDIAEDCDADYPPSHGAIKYAVQDALRDKP